MKNAIVIIIGLLMSLHLNAQKYFTRTGTTQFEASEKVFEPVEATNKSTTAIFNTKTGAVATQVFMAGFQFKNALMQEHFNENYMDSHQYPKAVFLASIHCASCCLASPSQWTSRKAKSFLLCLNLL